jgi:hypothetical protein
MDRMKKQFIYEMAQEINIVLFNGNLDISEINIIQPRKNPYNWLGYYIGNEIRIYPEAHQNEFDLMHTLAHEMVHYYQDILECPTNHNGALFRHFTKKWFNITGYDFYKNVN